MARDSAVKAYATDLAYIHDAGFGGVAQAAAQVVIDQLRAQGNQDGLVVELGCGSGTQAAHVTAAGYDVLGYDISPAMVALAKKQAPRGTFQTASFLDAEIPPCQLVTAISEIFNYLFDERNSLATLKRVFRRAFKALQPGGALLFDVALVGRIPGGIMRSYTTGSDWACLYEATEDERKRTLIRQITTFRSQGKLYRRDEETHRLKLFTRPEITAALREVGFRVRTLPGYGPLTIAPGRLVFLGTKPRS